MRTQIIEATMPPSLRESFRTVVELRLQCKIEWRPLIQRSGPS